MNWRTEYPRLFDLFAASDQDDIDNYFSLMCNDTTRLYGRETYEKWEGILFHLDQKAFRHLIKKSKKAVTIRDDRRGWEQLFNFLNEAKGYLFLKEQGYHSIEFIEETNSPTPDLYARSVDKSAVLEVKTIRKSDIDILRDRVWQSIDYIPDGLKNKILNDIANATEQLNGFKKNVDNRICYLILSLDLCLDMRKSNRSILSKFIESFVKPGLQIEFELHTA